MHSVRRPDEEDVADMEAEAEGGEEEDTERFAQEIKDYLGEVE